MKPVLYIFDAAKKRPYLVPTLLALLLLLIPSWLRPVHLPDEARYAEVSRDVLVNNHWLIPHINGIPHLTKPPLFYDLAALSFSILGKNFFAIRMVSLGAFLAGLLFCVYWAGKRGVPGAAALTGLIGVTMFQPVVAGQYADLNILMTAWITLGLLCFYQALERPLKRRWWYGAWIFFGLGFLTKGPPALMIPAGAIILYRLVSGRKFNRSPASWLAGILLYLAIAFPWYIWILLKEGEKLVQFWGIDIFHRTFASEEGPDAVPGYYIPVFLLGGAGWSVLAIYEIYIVHRRAKEKETKGVLPDRSFQKSSRPDIKKPGKIRRIAHSTLLEARKMPSDQLWLACWFIATVIPFSLLLAEMISYIQPCYPAFTLFLALYYARKKENGYLKRIRYTFLISFLLIAAILWGVSLVGVTEIRSPSLEVGESLAKHLEPHWIGLKLRRIEEGTFTLVQYDDYCPLYSFMSNCPTILVEETIHEEWTAPPELAASMEELNQWVKQNRPLVFLFEPERLDLFTGKEWENLNLIYKGSHYVLMSTKSLDSFWERELKPD